eukprot:m.19604 g.19604  ORF g.19604 m.19604 type:complete len:1657 (+) comp27869_c0_seq1:10-4980(+)
MSKDNSSNLLFFETFKHGASESEEIQLRLDLIRFKVPVTITEVRVIPLGWRMHPDIKSTGKTTPTSFKLELFLKNLYQPSSSVFEKFGTLEYDAETKFTYQNKEKIATDALALRGWYASISVSVYGCLADLTTPEVTEGMILGDGQEAKATVVSPALNGDKEKDEDGKKKQKKEDGMAVEEFEPISPGHAQDIMNMEENAQFTSRDKEYEEIESDEEIPDEIEEAEFGQDVDMGDLNFSEYTEDAWMSVSVSFNPYQCILSSFQYFDLGSKDLYGLVEKPPDEKSSELLDHIFQMNLNEYSAKWISGLEELPPLIEKNLESLAGHPSRDETIDRLVSWAVHAVNVNLAKKQPAIVNTCQLKAGMKLICSLSRWGSIITAKMIRSGVICKLLNSLEEPYMATSVKLAGLQALDHILDYGEGMENFFSWDSSLESTPYQRLIKVVLNQPFAGVMSGCSALLSKAHIYELLAELQKAVDGVVSASLLAEKAEETDGEVKVEPQEMQQGQSDEIGELEERFKKETREGFSYAKPPFWGQGYPTFPDSTTIVNTMRDLLASLKSAPSKIVQPSPGYIPLKVKLNDVKARDPYPALVHFFQSRRFLESILVLMSCPFLSMYPLMFASCRSLIVFLLGSQSGLLYLASESRTTNEIIRILLQATESDIHHSRVPPLSEFLRGDNLRNCTPQSLGLLMVYHLQAFQAVDIILDALKTKSDDHDAAEVLSTLHTLYSMTFTPLGKEAVVSILSLSRNLGCLLPFVEHRGVTELDEKLKKSVSSRYAAVLIMQTIQASETGEILEKYGSRLLAVSNSDHNNPSLTDLVEWLAPLKVLDSVPETGPIPVLVKQLKKQIEETSSAKIVNELPGLISLLRLLRLYSCPPNETSVTQNGKKNLRWSVAVISLFSSNAMEEFINLLQKLNAGLLRPWRQGQLTGSNQALLVFSLAKPLLSLITTMLSHLFTASEEFRDVRLFSTLLDLHVVLCSVLPSGNLLASTQQIQEDIASILSMFSQPLVPVTGEEERNLSSGCWYLMLKELLQHTIALPQNFYSGLVLLSELLPLPLPVLSMESLSEEDTSKVFQYHQLWAAHLSLLLPELETVLSSLADSSCPSLLHMFRRFVGQVADLSPSLSLMAARMLLRLLSDKIDMDQADISKLSTLRTLELVSVLSTQPSIKAGFLDALRNPGPDGPPSDLLVRMLDLLNSENCISEGVNAAIVSLLQTLCDPFYSVKPIEPPFTLQQLSDNMPDSSQLSSICDALVDFLDSGQSWHLITATLRLLTGFTQYEFSFLLLARALETSEEKLKPLLDRLNDKISSGPEVLVALAALSELVEGLSTKPVKKEHEETETEESVLRASYLTASQLRVLLDWTETAEAMSHPLLGVKEKLTEEKELEAVLGKIVELVKEDQDEDTGDENVVDLPAPSPLGDLFTSRRVVSVVMLVGESPELDFWYAGYPPEEAGVEVELVKSDLEDLSAKAIDSFSLKDEIEKTVIKSPPPSPTRTKKEKNRRRVDPLIAESFAKRFRTGGDSLFGGRGGGGNYRRRDMFRLRQQNTSRPPSMHVDDFVAIDNSMKPRKMDNRMLLGGESGGQSEHDQQQQQQQQRQQQQQAFMGRGGYDRWARGGSWSYMNMSRGRGGWPSHSHYGGEYGRGQGQGWPAGKRFY